MSLLKTDLAEAGTISSRLSDVNPTSDTGLRTQKFLKKWFIEMKKRQDVRLENLNATVGNLNFLPEEPVIS